MMGLGLSIPKIYKCVACGKETPSTEWPPNSMVTAMCWRCEKFTRWELQS